MSCDSLVTPPPGSHDGCSSDGRLESDLLDANETVRILVWEIDHYLEAIDLEQDRGRSSRRFSARR